MIFFKALRNQLNKFCLFLVPILFISIASTRLSVGQTLPSGFTRVLVANGISKPTVMAFTPDGRIFVGQQDGVLKVVKNGTLLSTPFMSLNVNSLGERGLIGIALDPNFGSNQYLYIYYTLPDASRNRISRFTANGDVVKAGSEVVLLNLDPLNANNHNGGAMHFGKDGKLYVAIGENAVPANSQNLDTYHGKLLRINPDGSVPSGNPHTSGTEQRKRIWASGLRNPYTFDIQPSTGRIFVNDVGQVTWEEINDATSAGKNFGWPAVEGTGTNASYVNPYFAYKHGSTETTGCAITGGVFFNPANTHYPAQYVGKYFYQDLCNRWIRVLDVSTSTPTSSSFATGIGTQALGLDVGTDGNLYYLERSTSSLYKIIYTINAAPAIVSHPASKTVSAGQPVSFSVTATGTAPLKYQWQKNGTNISGATSSTYSISSTTTSSAGTYRVIVSNGVGTATSNGATLTITSPNTAPVAEILTPAAGIMYRAGQTISFSGNATDKEDGALPSSAFSWSVDFHHDTHVHDGPPVTSGTKSGSFTIPTSGEVSANVWYRLILTVKDSKGLTSTVYRDIRPYKSTISFATQPAGLKLSLDGTQITTPYSVSSVEGIQRSIGVVSPQTMGANKYTFSHWVHGGAASQTITTPTNDVTYTAVYKLSFSPTKLEAESAYLSGPRIYTNHTGYSGTGFVDYEHAYTDYIEWTASVPSAGSYSLQFRYATTVPKSLQLKVNGAITHSSLAFSPTPNWDTWTNLTLNVNLQAGTNKIRTTAIGMSGPNIDYLIIGLATEKRVSPHAEGSETIAIYPNPLYKGSDLKIDAEAKQGEIIEMTLLNSIGKTVSINKEAAKMDGLNTMVIRIEDLRDGIYFVKVKKGKIIKTKRIMINNLPE